MTLLNNILQNIKFSPVEQKFRHLKKSNPKLKEFFFSLLNIEPLLKYLNFQENSEEFFISEQDF